MDTSIEFFEQLKYNEALTNNKNIFYQGISPKYFPKQIFITPYRNRPKSLELFKEKAVPYFKHNMKFDSTFIIVEQDEDHDFNLGYLVNCGYTWYKNVLKRQFHVNDMIWMYPIDVYPIKANLHVYDNAIYSDAFGKIIGTKCNIFEMIGGFSNNYFGYGMEDHDIYARSSIYGVPRLYLENEYEIPEVPTGDSLSEPERFSQINKNIFYKNAYSNNIHEGLKTTSFKLKKEKLYGNNYYHITVKLNKNT